MYNKPWLVTIGTPPDLTLWWNEPLSVLNATDRLNQYRLCWWPGSWCHQDIGGHGVRYITSCFHRQSNMLIIHAVLKSRKVWNTVRQVFFSKHKRAAVKGLREKIIYALLRNQWNGWVIWLVATCDFPEMLIPIYNSFFEKKWFKIFLFFNFIAASVHRPVDKCINNKMTCCHQIFSIVYTEPLLNLMIIRNIFGRWHNGVCHPSGNYWDCYRGTRRTTAMVLT